jgi:hypothetical protein
MEDIDLKKVLCRHSDARKIDLNEEGGWYCQRCEKALSSETVRKVFEETFDMTADYMFRLMTLYGLSIRNRRQYELQKKMIEEKKARIRKHMDDYYNSLRSKN